jgi:glycosyltransferase involved in cell wall biosynthesis
MISLFVFKSNARNMQYGIGTYIRELTQSLLTIPDINICIVSFKSHECKEFSARTGADRISEITIPYPFFQPTQINSFENKYASAVVRLLSDIIPKDENVIFQINSIDDLPLATKLKEYFNYPLISIVHAASWQMMFDGNREKIHGLNIENPSNCLEFTMSREREMYRQSDHIVSVTKYMKDFLVNEYLIDTDKITTIHNGFDFSKSIRISEKEKIDLRKKLGFRKSDVIILFSGRIDPCKGVFYLIEAFQKACKHNSQIRLVVLGQGSIENCQKKTNSFFGRVTYTGFLSEETVLSFYYITDIGIVPSIYDHCPYSALEMMANRIPLIVSRINGLDEIFTNEDCLFVNPDVSTNGDIAFNVQGLTDAILTLAGYKELRIKFAANSYNRLKRDYSSRDMADNMFNLFNSLSLTSEESIENELINRK